MSKEPPSGIHIFQQVVVRKGIWLQKPCQVNNTDFCCCKLKQRHCRKKKNFRYQTRNYRTSCETSAFLEAYHIQISIQSDQNTHTLAKRQLVFRSLLCMTIQKVTKSYFISSLEYIFLDFQYVSRFTFAFFKVGKQTKVLNQLVVLAVFQSRR